MSKNIEKKILSLDDEVAIQILRTIAKHHSTSDVAESELTKDAQEALRNEFELSAATDPVSDGEMARSALLLLAEDPQMRKIMSSPHFLSDGPYHRFGLDPAALIGLSAAAIFVLQSFIQFKINSKGEWEFHFKKKPTKDSILKPFLEKLLSWIPKGPHE